VLGVHISGLLKGPVQQSAGECVALQGERQGWKEKGWGGRLLLLLLLLVVGPSAG
jgi:hypothetical protein